MAISQLHNLSRPVAAASRPYGLRVSLRPGDPFRKLLGEHWSRTHWYAAAVERDQAMREMSRRHEYSRRGDDPALVFERLENLSPRAG